MELSEFKRAYNARIKEMGAQARAECLGVIEKADYSGPEGAAGKAQLLSVRTQGIGLMHIDGAIKGCIVHAPLEKGKAVDGLIVYSACIDVLMGTNEKQRNELLDRLHLFDGKLTGKGSKPPDEFIPNSNLNAMIDSSFSVFALSHSVSVAPLRLLRST